MAGERVLITGIRGQDGSYLADLLLDDGDEVAGFFRHNSTGDLGNSEHLKGKITLYRGNLDDEVSIAQAIRDFKPTEIYNLGAEAAPADSFKMRSYTSKINHIGALNVFNSALEYGLESDTDLRVYQASSSEMLGKPPVVPQDEDTLMKPNNHYGIAKHAAHEDARVMREGTTHLNIRCGILFNHESPRRGTQYVTRKVTVGVASIKNGLRDLPLSENGRLILNGDRKLVMGDLTPHRDWGAAWEYVEAMKKIMRYDAPLYDRPDDFVIATGEMHSIQELLEVAFGYAGLDWREHVLTSEEFKRPMETGPLCGNAAKAKRILGWEPRTKFKELIKIMVEADLEKFTNRSFISLPSEVVHK